MLLARLVNSSVGFGMILSLGTISLLLFSNVGKIKKITTIRTAIPVVNKIFLRLFLAREPTNPDINYNLFTSLSMSKIYWLLYTGLGSKE